MNPSSTNMASEVSSSSVPNMSTTVKRTHEDAGLSKTTEDKSNPDGSQPHEPPSKVLVSDSGSGDSNPIPKADTNPIPTEDSSQTPKLDSNPTQKNESIPNSKPDSNLAATKVDASPSLTVNSSVPDLSKKSDVKDNSENVPVDSITTSTEPSKPTVEVTVPKPSPELTVTEQPSLALSETDTPKPQSIVTNVNSEKKPAAPIPSSNKDTAAVTTAAKNTEEVSLPKKDTVGASVSPKNDNPSKSTTSQSVPEAKDLNDSSSSKASEPMDTAEKPSASQSKSGTEPVTPKINNEKESDKTPSTFLLPKKPTPSDKQSTKPQQSGNSNSVASSTSEGKSSDAKQKKKERDEKKSLAIKSSNKTPEQTLKHMESTFLKRRNFITNEIPTIPQLKEKYPDLFNGKQLLIEFQRITKIDIDQKIQEFCVRFATAVIEMARGKKGSEPVLARWEQAKQENDTLKQYWDMVTAICLLPLHFGEHFHEMVKEIGEDEEVEPNGQLVPILVARGNIFRTDEFFLIAENSIVQEFEEFTIAFASLYSSYWVFNMEYPNTIENTYNYIQRCIVRQREPGTVPQVCKAFTKSLQKWNKGKENK